MIPTIVKGEAAKWAAFRTADAALAASGTVTLELGLSGVPMIVAYRVSKIEEILKYLIKAHSIVLTNLVLGENVIPGIHPMGLHAGQTRRSAAAAPCRTHPSGAARRRRSRRSTA